jgi:hypothetical protein
LKPSIYEWIRVSQSSYEGDPLTPPEGEAAQGEIPP